MASPWSPVGSLEDEEEEVAAIEASPHQQEQQQNDTGASGQQQQRKRAISVGASSSSNKSRKSQVWKDFKIVSPEDAEEVVAECLHCHKKLKADSKNGTSSLSRHLKSFHPTNRAEVGNYFIKSEKNDDGSVALKNYKVDVAAVRTAVSMFLLGGAHPFTIVDEHGFKNLLSLACPQYKQVGRHTIRRDIMEMFNKEKKEVIEAIANSPGRVSFTSDNWKSDCQKYNYICITGHYIDAQWKLHKRILWFKKLNPPHDGASIADEVHLCFREWKVDSKIMCMTLDNASYNDTMIQTLTQHLAPKGVLPLWGTFFQVRCCAHILNLVVQAGLKLIDASVDKLRDGIQYIKASNIRMHKFYDAAEKLFQLNTKRRLKVDMPVRWNSTYQMIETAVYFKSVLEHFSKRDSTFRLHFWPSPLEWNKLHTMQKFLKTFYDATCIFSGTKYPTSNLYFRAVFMVHSRLIEALNDSENFMTPMLREMKAKFDKYWSDYSLILSCAAILDPRYKIEFLCYCYGKLYGDEGERRIDEVKRIIETLFHQGYRGSTVAPNSTDDASARPNDASSGADMFSDYGKFLSARRTHEEKSQLDLYLAEPTKDINQPLDVLDYWSKTSARYPELALMARDVLAIPVSSVASESAFSMGRKVITFTRSCLGSKTIEALMCLQDWYRERMDDGAAASTTTKETTDGDGEETSDPED